MKIHTYITTLTVLLLALQVKGQTYTLDQMIALSEGINMEQQRSDFKMRMAQLDIEVLEAAQGWRLTADAHLPNYFKSSRGIVQPNGSIAFQDVSQNTGRLGFTLSKPITKYNTMLYAETNLLRFDDLVEGNHIYNGVPLRVGIRQALNAHNSIKWNKKILRKKAEISRIQDKQASEFSALQVTQRYFGLLHAQVNQAIASSNLRNSEEIYRLGKERYDIGKISRSDLLQIELSLKNSRQSKISAGRDLLDKTYRLQEATNSFDLTDISVKEPTVLPELRELPQDMAQKAWEKHPDKAALELELLQTMKELDRAKKETGFRANIEASIGLTKRGATPADIYKQPKTEALVNLKLNIPIYDSGHRRKSIARVRMEEQLGMLNKEFNEASFKKNIEQMVQQMELIKEEVSMSKESFDIAKERYDIANKRFAVGNINITELYIAYRERDQAWRNHIYALEQYYTRYYMIRTMIL